MMPSAGQMGSQAEARYEVRRETVMRPMEARYKARSWRKVYFGCSRGFRQCPKCSKCPNVRCDRRFQWATSKTLDQRFSTGWSRPPRGSPDDCRGSAGIFRNL